MKSAFLAATAIGVLLHLAKAAAFLQTAPAPVVTSFSPAEGRPLLNYVSIFGENILDAESVEFNGVKAAFSTSGEALSAQVPFGVSTGPLTVRTPHGLYTTTNVFTAIVGLPKVTDFPPAGEVGSLVYFNGEHLSEAVDVRFNGVAAEFFLMGALVAYVPANATSGPITIVTLHGSFTTASFTVLRPVYGPPVVSSFSPDSGSPNTTVTIKGANFNGLVSVSFGGAAVTAAWMVDSIFARVPTNAVTGPITVTTTNGTVTTTEIFTVLPMPPPTPPQVGAVFPQPVEVEGTLYVTGLGFDQVTEVQLNGRSVEFAVTFANTWVFLTVPADATSGVLTLLWPGGSASSPLIIKPKPRLTGFVPEKGAPGTLVQLIGSDLDQVTAVSLGALPVPYDKSQFAFTVPFDAASGPITIASAFSQSTSSQAFTVTHDLDLGLRETQSRSSLVAPALLTLQMVVTNKGDSLVRDVRLTDRFLLSPDRLSGDEVEMKAAEPLGQLSELGLILVGVLASQGHAILKAGAVEAELGEIAGHSAVTISVEVRVNQRGVLYHLADVSAAGSDPDPRDNLLRSAIFVPDAAELTIRSGGAGHAEICWPKSPQSFLLQTSEPWPGAPWSTLEMKPTDKGEWNCVTISTAAGSQLYRLYQSAAGVSPSP